MRVMQGVGPDSRLWVLLLGLAIALAACGPTATPTIVPVRPAEGQAVVVVDVAPLRAGPGLDFAIVGSLTYGTVVTRVGVSPDGGWYQVTRTDPSAEMDPAWIKADFISSWTATPTPSPGPSRLPTTTPTLRPAPTPSIRATALGGGRRNCHARPGRPLVDPRAHRAPDRSCSRFPGSDGAARG